MPRAARRAGAAPGRRPGPRRPAGASTVRATARGAPGLSPAVGWPGAPGRRSRAHRSRRRPLRRRGTGPRPDPAPGRSRPPRRSTPSSTLSREIAPSTSTSAASSSVGPQVMEHGGPVDQRRHGVGGVAEDLEPERVERPDADGTRTRCRVARAPHRGAPRARPPHARLNVIAATLSRVDARSRRARRSARRASSSCRSPPAPRPAPGPARPSQRPVGRARASRAGPRRRDGWPRFESAGDRSPGDLWCASAPPPPSCTTGCEPAMPSPFTSR